MNIANPMAQEFQGQQSVGLFLGFRCKDFAVVQYGAEHALLRMRTIVRSQALRIARQVKKMFGGALSWVIRKYAEPQTPISAEITDLTGITDEMVLGHRIDPDAVAAFASDAMIIIAHNAGFDRKFAERYWPLFEQKPWACSATEVEWRKHGFDGSRLGYLLAGVGLFHQAHRAIDYCRALVEILASDLSKPNRSALAVLLERARRKTLRIWAEQSPFELKDELKKRGYRWSDGADGRPRSWYIDVDAASEASEIEFLRTTIYLREVEPRIQAINAINRFSRRV